MKKGWPFYGKKITETKLVLKSGTKCINSNNLFLIFLKLKYI